MTTSAVFAIPVTGTAIRGMGSATRVTIAQLQNVPSVEAPGAKSRSPGTDNPLSRVGCIRLVCQAAALASIPGIITVAAGIHKLAENGAIFALDSFAVRLHCLVLAGTHFADHAVIPC